MQRYVPGAQIAMPPSPRRRRRRRRQKTRIAPSWHPSALRTSRAGIRQAGAGHTLVLAVGGAPSIDATTAAVWDHYARSCRYPGLASAHTVRVGEDWFGTVAGAGLACVGGMLTLQAVPVAAPAGVEAWRALWVRQGRGTGLVLEHGIVVRRDTETAHAATLEAGVRLLDARARDRLPLDPGPVPDSVVVRLADSRRAGNCVTGTANWIELAGLAGRTSATAGELRAAAVQVGQASRVEAAIRVAARRSRL